MCVSQAFLLLLLHIEKICVFYFSPQKFGKKTNKQGIDLKTPLEEEIPSSVFFSNRKVLNF